MGTLLLLYKQVKVPWSVLVIKPDLATNKCHRYNPSKY